MLDAIINQIISIEPNYSRLLLKELVNHPFAFPAHPNVTRILSSKPYYPDAPMPIEHLRWPPQGKKQSFEKVFLSSGTSGDVRSRGEFSKLGLLFYELAAVSSFSYVLKLFFGEDWHKKGAVQGYSLVPTSQSWPESSLAQMLTWISHYARVELLDQASLVNLEHQLAWQNDPIWIFATGLQIAELYESGFRRKLPTGSVVIETGGPKGSKKNLDSDTICKMIEEVFDLNQEQIISEYGMCELSSQAYRVRKNIAPFHKDLFRFPTWVQLGIQSADEKIVSEGQGSLVITDWFRVDLNASLRVQDLVNLRSDGSFSLLGRVQSAPLKGCSISLEDFFTKSKTSVSKKIHNNDSLEKTDLPCSKFEIDFTSATKLLLKFIKNPQSKILLSQETGSYQDAKFLLKSLIEAVPAERAAWKAAIGRSVENIDRMPQQWFFFPPSQHSFALLYPLTIALALGVRISIVASRRSSSMGFLKYFAKSLSSLGTKIEFLDKECGVNQIYSTHDPSEDKAIFCMGSNESLKTIKSEFPARVFGFGTSLTLSAVRASEVEEQMSMLAQDCFSLGQRGCLSSRMLFLHVDQEINFGALSQKMSDAFKKYWGADLDWRSDQALMHEAVRYRYFFDHAKIARTLARPMFVGLDGHLCAKANFSQMLSSTRFCLPVLMYRSEAELWKSLNYFCTKHPEIKRLGLSPSLLDLDRLPISCVLGRSQFYPWNGTYESHALFSEIF